MQYMPCIPSARVITSLYPEGIATNTVSVTQYKLHKKMTKTTLDTAPSLLSSRRRQYMQRIRLARPTNGLTQNPTLKALQNSPTPTILLQRNSPTLLTTAAKKQPHPTTQCILNCCSTILGITTKPKKLASTLLQNSSSPQKKEPLLVHAMVKQN